MKSTQVALFTILYLSTLAPALAEPCPQELAIEGFQVKASASIWGNLWGKDGTLQERITTSLNKAFEELPKKSCPESCGDGGSKVQLEIFPVKTKTSNYCSEKLEQTLEEPWVYRDESVSDLKDLDSWINDVSRGNNAVGEDIYKKCDEDCSPAYKLFIKGSPEELTTDAFVTCGHQRDKSENYYWLKITYLLSCS